MGWLGDGGPSFVVWTLERRESKEPEGCTQRFHSEARSASAFIVNIDEVISIEERHILLTVSCQRFHYCVVTARKER